VYSDVFDAISIIGDWPEKKILSLVTAVQLNLLFRLSATSDGTIVIIIIIIIIKQQISGTVTFLFFSTSESSFRFPHEGLIHSHSDGNSWDHGTVGIVVRCSPLQRLFSDIIYILPINLSVADRVTRRVWQPPFRHDMYRVSPADWSIDRLIDWAETKTGIRNKYTPRNHPLALTCIWFSGVSRLWIKGVGDLGTKPAPSGIQGRSPCWKVRSKAPPPSKRSLWAESPKANSFAYLRANVASYFAHILNFKLKFLNFGPVGYQVSSQRGERTPVSPPESAQLGLLSLWRAWWSSWANVQRLCHIKYLFQ